MELKRQEQTEQPRMTPAIPGFDNIGRYWDRINELYAAKILPGQFYVTRANENIVTVLGSCVSACIRDPVNGVGGMNHFMLPQADLSKLVKMSDAARYGNNAMEMMINAILKNGGHRENLEVKVFGGGRILANMTDIGIRNIEFVKDYIKMEGMNLVAEDLGDTCPRKIYYFPLTGKVRVKRLRSLHNDTIIKRESVYLQEIKQAPVAGEIDLF